jgi:diphthamide biosynthesis protein 3
MISYYDEVDIEDMDYDDVAEVYYYPCPCGDKFEISLEDLRNGEETGLCPSCSLIIK